MKDFFRSARFKILLALMVVLLGFLIASVYSGGAAPLFSRLLGMLTTPFQQAAAGISGGVGGFFERYMNAADTYERNEALQRELTGLREQLADYDKVKHENEQLREILDVMESHQDRQVVTADVIARSPAGRYNSFSINRGTMDGVAYLDPVMTPDGLVGYVSEVGMSHSTVSTILDAAVDVGAYVSSTRDIGIVSGTVDLSLEGLCSLDYLPRESEIAAGDLILTSGGPLFPRDIIIGTVREVRPNAHGTGLVAVVAPAAPVDAVKNVFVITQFEGQGQE